MGFEELIKLQHGIHVALHWEWYELHVMIKCHHAMYHISLSGDEDEAKIK